MRDSAKAVERTAADLTFGELVARIEELERAVARLGAFEKPQAAPDIFTREEAAKYARISVRTLDGHINAGALDAPKRGNRVWIRRDVLDAFIAGGAR
jgi:excisionase family DNA binding protein